MDLIGPGRPHRGREQAAVRCRPRTYLLGKAGRWLYIVGMKDFRKYHLPPPLNDHEIPDFLSGYFLISETNLQDPNFYRTVVFILSHDSGGAIGLVINRPSNTSLAELSEGLEDTPFADYPVYIGGPVDRNYLFALHSGLPDGSKSDGAIEAVEEVIFEPDFELLYDYFTGLEEGDAAEESPDIRFYAGYAGWAPGQLENELSRRDWVVLPGSSRLVFSPDPETAWREALFKKGGLYWVAAETGSSPSLN